MKILCIGDIVGKPGRDVFAKLIQPLKEELGIHFVIVNGENAAAGSGITERLAKELFTAGADAITLGDHTWDKKEIGAYLDKEPRIIRPLNFPEGAPGQGLTCIKCGSKSIGIINLLGRTFMKYNVECPFRSGLKAIEELRKQTPMIVVDMHAETTSEKVAIGHYLDGQASILFGTHTHIQTADEKILPKGTAYITDLGMTGPYDSVIGQNKEFIINRFLTSLPNKFEVASDQVGLHGIVVELDEESGKALNIQRVQRFLDA